MDNDELNEGFILLHRKIMKTSWYATPLTCCLAVHCLLRANWEDKKIIWNSQEMVIPRGAFVTGRKALSEETGISQRSVRTALTTLKTTSFLTIKTTSKFSIIYIVRYDDYQLKVTSKTTSKTTSKRPTNDQQTTTDNKLKAFNELNKEVNTLSGKPDVVQEIIEYLNTKAGTAYRATTPATKKLIQARLKEGFTLEDFRRVIDNKCAAWLHDGDMSKYLRPATLFMASKFEGYLNESKPESAYKLTPEDEAKIEKLRKQEFEAGQIAMGRVRVLTPSGQERWVPKTEGKS